METNKKETTNPLSPRRHDGAGHNLEDLKVTVPPKVKRTGAGKLSAPLPSPPRPDAETFLAKAGHMPGREAFCLGGISLSPAVCVIVIYLLLIDIFIFFLFFLHSFRPPPCCIPQSPGGVAKETAAWQRARAGGRRRPLRPALLLLLLLLRRRLQPPPLAQPPPSPRLLPHSPRARLLARWCASRPRIRHAPDSAKSNREEV